MLCGKTAVPSEHSIRTGTVIRHFLDNCDSLILCRYKIFRQRIKTQIGKL